MMNRMASQTEMPIVIAISLRSLKPHPFPTAIFPRPQQAVIVGKSIHRDYSIKFETGPLNEEQTRLCRLLQHHGSTVIEFSDEEYWFHRDRIRWEESMIRKALDRVAALYPDSEEMNDMSTYDSEFANAVLAVASKAFPKQLAMTDLKRELAPELSNQALFTAIDALEADDFIEAKSMRSGLRNEIQDVAYIRATLKGRNHLSAQSPPPAVGPVFHGDQINNYGTVGAVGRNAQGVVNVYERSSSVEEQVDLQVLAIQLEQLRTEYRKTATSREDDKQLALLGDAAEAAEKGDGKGVASLLSRAGKGVLKMAKDIGTDVAAKVIVEMAKES
jgi:hypothetical protein